MQSGKIEVITGCMFAGKTEEVLRRLRRAQINNQEIKIIKPEIDDRYGQETVRSHSGDEMSAETISVSEKGLDRLEEIEADVIAVDEFNFFKQEFIPVLDRKADTGTRVIISGLDQDYRGNPFTPMENMLAIADELRKLNAICEKCGDEATKTQRIVDGEPAPKDMETVQVGGQESYEARCRECHELKNP